MPPLHVTVGLLLVLVLPAAALFIRARGDRSTDWSALRQGLALQWVVTVALIALVLVTMPLVDVLSVFGGHGGDPATDTMVAFILIGGVGVGSTLGARVFTGVPVDDVTRAIIGLSPGRKLLLGVTAGVTEELVLRGFLITQLVALGTSTVGAAAISVVLAVATHASRRSVGRLALGVPLQVAFVLAFLVTGNVLACIVAHVTYDALVLLTTHPSDLPA